MKKSFIVGLSAALITIAVSRVAVADYLYGLDAWEENILWIIDPADGSTIGGHRINLETGSINTLNGMAVDPTSGTMYAVINLSGTSARGLYTLDPETGDASLIGTTAVPIASIAFDDAGTLYAASGNSSSIPADDRNALFEIDPTDATLTRICKLGNANQGHALSYGDGLLYHAQSVGQNWSGATVLESIDPASFPVTSTDACTKTDIPLTYGDGTLYIHPMSILVTATGTGTATLLLSGWATAGSCCDPELFSIAVDSGNAEATKIGDPDSFFKGMDYHAFEPTSFASLEGISVSKTATKYRDGKSKHVQFTIGIYNNSGDSISDLTLVDDLDTSRISYNADNFGCDLISNFRVQCDLGTIDAFSSQSITIDTVVNCKGKNCSSVSNFANVNLSLDQWIAEPTSTSTGSGVFVELKGKY